MKCRATASDIRLAADCKLTLASYCPIARAITRALGWDLDEERVKVHPSYALIDGARYPLPPSARAFVRAFDAVAWPKPISFEMEGP